MQFDSGTPTDVSESPCYSSEKTQLELDCCAQAEVGTAPCYSSEKTQSEPDSCAQAATSTFSCYSSEKTRSEHDSGFQTEASTCLDTVSVRYSSEEQESRKAERAESVEVDARMQRWLARRLARKQRRNSVQHYGYLARAAVNSDNENELSNIAQETGLPIAITEQLGSGSFARVYRGAWVGTGAGTTRGPESPKHVAVKIIRRRRSLGQIDSDGHVRIPRWLAREAETSTAMRHPNLVRVLRAHVEKRPYVFVMEFCEGGTLHELLHAAGAELPKPCLDTLNWRQRLKVATDVAAGMEYMHAHSVMHRDLKTQNVMLAKAIQSPEDVPQAKVGDFGLACLVERGAEILTRQVGSAPYMAPEVLDDPHAACDPKLAHHYNEKVDVYSFAMILFEMLTDEVPFSHLSSSGILRLGAAITQGQRPKVSVEFRDKIPRHFHSLMTRCWSQNAADRPGFRSTHSELRKASRFGPVDCVDACQRRMSLAVWRLCGGSSESTLPHALARLAPGAFYRE